MSSLDETIRGYDKASPQQIAPFNEKLRNNIIRLAGRIHTGLPAAGSTLGLYSAFRSMRSNSSLRWGSSACGGPCRFTSFDHPLHCILDPVRIELPSGHWWVPTLRLMQVRGLRKTMSDYVRPCASMLACPRFDWMGL